MRSTLGSERVFTMNELDLIGELMAKVNYARVFQSEVHGRWFVTPFFCCQVQEKGETLFSRDTDGEFEQFEPYDLEHWEDGEWPWRQIMPSTIGQFPYIAWGTASSMDTAEDPVRDLIYQVRGGKAVTKLDLVPLTKAGEHHRSIHRAGLTMIEFIREDAKNVFVDSFYIDAILRLSGRRELHRITARQYGNRHSALEFVEPGGAAWAIAMPIRTEQEVEKDYRVEEALDLLDELQRGVAGNQWDHDEYDD